MVSAIAVIHLNPPIRILSSREGHPATFASRDPVAGIHDHSLWNMGPSIRRLRASSTAMRRGRPAGSMIWTNERIAFSSSSLLRECPLHHPRKCGPRRRSSCARARRSPRRVHRPRNGPRPHCSRLCRRWRTAEIRERAAETPTICAKPSGPDRRSRIVLGRGRQTRADADVIRRSIRRRLGLVSTVFTDWPMIASAPSSPGRLPRHSSGPTCARRRRLRGRRRCDR